MRKTAHGYVSLAANPAIPGRQMNKWLILTPALRFVGYTARVPIARGAGITSVVGNVANDASALGKSCTIDRLKADHVVIMKRKQSSWSVPVRPTDFSGFLVRRLGSAHRCTNGARNSETLSQSALVPLHRDYDRFGRHGHGRTELWWSVPPCAGRPEPIDQSLCAEVLGRRLFGAKGAGRPVR